MKNIIYSTLNVFLSLIAVGMFLPALSAAEQKPVVTVSFAGGGELTADMQAIEKLTGMAGLTQQTFDKLQVVMEKVMPTTALAGLDQKQPIGAVLTCDENAEFKAYAFLPISDLQQLMEKLKSPLGESPKADNGIYEIQVSDSTPPVFAVQRGNWAFISDKKETLDAVANDPVALLGDLPKKYLLAVKVMVKNIPEPARQMGLAQMQMFMQMAGTPPDMIAQNTEQYEKLSKEIDELTVGMILDRQTNNLTLDLEIIAKPGTNMATQAAAAKPGKSDFTGVKLPGAAISINAAAAITDADLARMKTSLETLRASTQEELKNQELEKEQLDLANQVLNDLFGVAVKTLEMKKADYGAALILEPDAVTLAAGSILADSAKLEDAIKKLLAEAEKEELAKINAETYKDFRLHGISLPVPDQSLAPFFGETIDVVIAVSDQKGFIAAGRNADKTLKEAIDKSISDAGKEIPASEVVISGLKIAKFASAVASDGTQEKVIAAMLSGALAQAGDKDHVTVVTNSVENGILIRVQIEEGIIKAVGGLAAALSMMPGM